MITLRDGMSVRAVNRTHDMVVAERAVVAASPWSRARGLLGRPSAQARRGAGHRPLPQRPHAGHGISNRCRTSGREMGWCVTITRHLRPWRFGPLVWGAHLALELPGRHGSREHRAIGSSLSPARAEPRVGATSRSARTRSRACLRGALPRPRSSRRPTAAPGAATSWNRTSRPSGSMIESARGGVDRSVRSTSSIGQSSASSRCPKRSRTVSASRQGR